MARTKKMPDFEKSLDQLEELIDDMESGDLSLEESLKSFEQGIKLTRDCQSALSQAEQKVQLLLADNNNITTAPFDDDADNSDA